MNQYESNKAELVAAAERMNTRARHNGYDRPTQVGAIVDITEPNRPGAPALTKDAGPSPDLRKAGSAAGNGDNGPAAPAARKPTVSEIVAAHGMVADGTLTAGEAIDLLDRLLKVPCVPYPPQCVTCGGAIMPGDLHTFDHETGTPKKHVECSLSDKLAAEVEDEGRDLCGSARCLAMVLIAGFVAAVAVAIAWVW